MDTLLFWTLGSLKIDTVDTFYPLETGAEVVYEMMSSTVNAIVLLVSYRISLIFLKLFSQNMKLFCKVYET